METLIWVPDYGGFFLVSGLGRAVGASDDFNKGFCTFWPTESVELNRLRILA